jgi:hypothetical protein
MEAKYPQYPVRPVVHVFLDIGMPEVDLRCGMCQLWGVKALMNDLTSAPSK